MNANLASFLLALAIAAVYWAVVKVVARFTRTKRRVDDHPLESWANDGGPVLPDDQVHAPFTSDRPETNVERAERYRRAAANSRKQSA